MAALVFDVYPRPIKENDWSVKSHTMQPSLVGAVRRYIYGKTWLCPAETKRLPQWFFDPGGMYCHDWPIVTVRTDRVAVEVAALHLGEFIARMKGKGAVARRKGGRWALPNNSVCG